MLRYLLLVFVLTIYNTLSTFAQSGCTDPLATNYSSTATTNDGSCLYQSTSTYIDNLVQLPAALDESSGLIYTNGHLWTIIDNDSATIYKISEVDSTILQRVNITNATNVDWEEITADATHFYIGDFGNNANGSRQNLKIYKLAKSSIGNAPIENVSAEIINFSYSDQTDFTPKLANNTEFDCEAFIVKDGQLHLFTKDWVGKRTKHYTLPTTPGTYIATYQEDYNVNGLISGAVISPDNINEIILIGYSGNLQDLFMWILYDYSGNYFFSGNKRKIDLGKSVDPINRENDRGQIEGITFTGQRKGYISSEAVDQTVFGFRFIVPPRIYKFTADDWIPLPVELFNFTANATDQGILLSWQTASETNNDYFTIERSENGTDFQEISRQKGAVDSKSIRNYQFTDTDPLYGTNYYRLKQTDINGTFTYSGIRSVESKLSNIKIEVNPVPVRHGEMLTIQIKGVSVSYGKLILRSMDGKIRLEQPVFLTKNLPLHLQTQHIRPGMYVLQIENNSRFYTSKVVIY